jgi:hypothetical protein
VYVSGCVPLNVGECMCLGVCLCMYARVGGTVCLLITMNKRNSIRSPSLRRTTLTGGRVKRADKMQN